MAKEKNVLSVLYHAETYALILVNSKSLIILSYETEEHKEIDILVTNV